MQSSKLGSLWVWVSMVVNSVTLLLSGNTLWPCALTWVAESPHYLVPGSWPLRGVTLDFSSYCKSPFFASICCNNLPLILHHLLLILCHTSSMLESHSAEHVAIHDHLTTNETLNHTHKVSCCSQLPAFTLIFFWTWHQVFASTISDPPPSSQFCGEFWEMSTASCLAHLHLGHILPTQLNLAWYDWHSSQVSLWSDVIERMECLLCAYSNGLSNQLHSLDFTD